MQRLDILEFLDYLLVYLWTRATTCGMVHGMAGNKPMKRIPTSRINSINPGRGLSHNLGYIRMRKGFIEQDTDIERANDQASVSSGKTQLIFEMNIDSPLKRPLSGTPLTWQPGQVDGLCPLCNNEAHEEIDKYLMSHLDDVVSRSEAILPAPWENISSRTIRRHASLHIGALYALLCASRTRTDTLRENEYLDETVEGFFDNLAAFSREGERRISENRIKERYDHTTNDPVPLENDTILLLEGSPVPVHRGKWYAMEGGTVTGPLRKWSKERTLEEMAIRQHDALNFFDEMLDIREKSMDIYDEAMEPHEVIRKDGSSYTMKDLPVALSALKERRSVAETMAKVGLIAAKLGSSDGKTAKLSPELSSMLEDLKILSRDQVTSFREANEGVDEADEDES
jgi:hypothetical protein